MNKGLRTFMLVVAVGGLLAVLPATSMGGLGLGNLVASDFSKGKSALAVATAKVSDPGKMSAVIKSSPRHRVAWGYTSYCFRTSPPGYSQWPPPGQYEDSVSVTPLRKTLKTGGLKDPDYCNVSVSAKLDYNSAKSVTAKIFNK